MSALYTEVHQDAIEAAAAAAMGIIGW